MISRPTRVITHLCLFFLIAFTLPAPSTRAAVPAIPSTTLRGLATSALFAGTPAVVEAPRVEALAGTPGVGGTVWQTKIEAPLRALAPGQVAEFIVYLADQADLSGAAQLKTKSEKGHYVYTQLIRAARRSQPAVLSALDRLGVDARPYWIANLIWVRGDVQAIQAMAQRADVARIDSNPRVRLQEPAQSPQPAAPAPLQAAGVEWNLRQVNADKVWAAGITGQGAVIGGQDTGYEWTHPALKGKYRGWDGANADHNYNWHDAVHTGGGACGPDSSQPCDDHGHGTHTMGTMVGDDGAGNQVGMAPGARWIGCRNMDRGVGTPITYAECYQWFLAPTDLQGLNPRTDLAPDVINNSWGCPPNEGCTDPQVLKTAVENLRAAGILSVHSAGNEGPSCGSVSTPGAIYDSSFTVGATNSSDGIAGFSSRGPVFVDGSGRSKPDITAPGVQIRSSTRGGGYSTLEGTSMAGPHVAGLAALLISAYPALAGRVDLLEEIIRDSAIPIGSTGSCGDTAGQVPNNTFGSGRIDAWAAVNAGPRLTVVKRASAAEITAGELLTYTLDLNHIQGAGPIHSVALTDVLPLNTTFISATQPYVFDGKMLRWDFPTLESDESRSIEIAVRVPITATGTIENFDYGAANDSVAALAGDPVVTRVKSLYGFTLHPNRAGIAWPGRTLTYTHTITNTGAQVDAYELSLTSSLGWSALDTPSPLMLEPGASATLVVTVKVPDGTGIGTYETAQVMATSQGLPGDTATVIDVTGVGYGYYFPLLFKHGLGSTP